MKHMIAIAVLVAVALLLAGPATAADTVQFKLHADKGTQFKMNVTVDQDITQEFMGQELAIEQTMGFGTTFKVTDVDADGALTVEVKYDSVLFKQESAMASVEYDSTDPPDDIPMQAAAFAALVGRGFTMKLSPTAQILEIKGVDKMIDEIMESMDVPEGVPVEQVKNDLKRQFGDEGLKQQMQQMFRMLPDKPVGVGDSWDDEVTVGGMMPVITKSKYTVKAIENGAATIEVETTIAPDEKAKPVEMGNSTMAMKMTGNQKGTTQVDLKTGFPLKISMDQKVTGTITITSDELPGGEMEIPMTIESTIAVEGKVTTTDDAEDAE